MKGFSVVAGDDISVGKDVLGGKLMSARGSVSIDGIVTGDYSAGFVLGENLAAIPVSKLSKLETAGDQISAAGTVRAQLLEGVSISAGGDIEVDKEARDSLLRTRGALLMPRGRLISGEVRTVYGIEAEEIGTEAGASAQIHLCSEAESSRDYDDLLYRLKAHEAAEKLLRLYLGPYAENPELMKKLRPAEKQRIGDLRDKLSQLRQGQARLLEEKETLLAGASWQPEAKVNFLDALHRGVRVFAAGKEFSVVDDVCEKGTLKFDPASNEFVLGNYEPLKTKGNADAAQSKQP